MRLTVSVSDSFARIVEEEGKLAAGAIRRGVEAAGKAVQEELRGQVRAAGFKGGGANVARSWRLRVYPRPGVVTLAPTALVSTAAPNIVEAFDRGAPIRASNGRRYLCWPTGFNAAGGRRQAGSRGGLRVTPAEMVSSREAVVIRMPGNLRLRLWCLRARQASSRGGKSGRGKGRLRFFVGARNVEVNTGRGRAGEKAERTKALLARGLAPMFFLSTEVSPGKRLDVAGVAGRADGVLEREVGAALGRK